MRKKRRVLRGISLGAKFIVVLIGLVIIFQTNIKGVVASIFSTIQKNAGSVR